MKFENVLDALLALWMLVMVIAITVGVIAAAISMVRMAFGI